MKSTTGISKSTAKGKQTKVSNYRFWLVLSCAGLVGLWYVILVLLFLGTDSLTREYAWNLSPAAYSFFNLFSSIFILMLTSAVALPFAQAVFKRLHIEKPIVSAVAFFMSLVFGLSLFYAVVNYVYYGQAAIYGTLLGSMIFAGLVYGFAIRPLKHKLSSKKFLVVAIGLSILPIVLYLFWRLIMIKFL